MIVANGGHDVIMEDADGDQNKDALVENSPYGKYLVQIVQQIFEDSLAEIDMYIEKVGGATVQAVQDAVNVDLFNNIKRIPSLYRMMNREAPKRHLPYVETLLKPLEQLVAVARTRMAGKQLQKHEVL